MPARSNTFHLLTVLTFTFLIGIPVQAQNWGKRTTQTPPSARQLSAIVYDSAHHGLLLFGGFQGSTFLGDTWVSDGLSWTQRTPAASPSIRAGHAMAMDEAGHVVLFGGANPSPLGDTWVWDGKTWTQKSPLSSPPARSNHSMVYDSAHKQVVLFGGKGASSLLDDTWVWDGNNWTQLSPANKPTARGDYAMTADGASHVVLFGGLNSSNTALNDTWIWNGTNWAQQSPASSPSARSGHSLTYDAGHSLFVLFGGLQGSTRLADTWIWNGTTWTQKTPNPAPTARSGAATTFDGARGQVFMFGGGDSSALSDVWVYPGNTMFASGGSPQSIASGSGGAAFQMTVTDVDGFYVPNFTFPIFGGALTAVIDDRGRWNLTGFGRSVPIAEPLILGYAESGWAKFITTWFNWNGGGSCVVTSGSDDYSSGTLRERVALCGANGVITFAPNVTTVTLAQGADIPLTQSITIDGGNTVTIDANNQSRHFFVTGGTVTLKNLTLVNGLAKGGNGGSGSQGGGGAAGMGGSIFQNGGVLTLSKVTFSNNQARGGNGGPGTVGGPGGGGGVGDNGGFGGTAARTQKGNGGSGGDFGGNSLNGGDGSGGDGGTANTPGFGGGSGGHSAAAAGGFGGGSAGGSSTSGTGGTFAGNGNTGATAHGGGGAGLGGALFARQGVLVLDTVVFSGNSAVKGTAGGAGATDGQGKGGSMFIMSPVIAVNFGSAPSFSGSSASNAGTGTACNTVVGPTAQDSADLCGSIQFPTVTATSGSGQGAQLETYFGEEMVVTVTPTIKDLPITFSAPTSGASMLPVSPTINTDTSGVAKFVPFANLVLGQYDVKIVVGGYTTTAKFTLTNLAAPNLTVSKTHVGTFQQGGTGEWRITVSNAAGSAPAKFGIFAMDTLPAGYTINSLSGTPAEWNCNQDGASKMICLGNFTVPGGSSYPVIKILVNIPANAAASATNTAISFGGGDPVHKSEATAASGSDTVSVLQNPTSIAATAGTPQSGAVTAAFGTNLKAVVKDIANATIANASVTFEAPASGPSGTFGAPCNSRTCVVTTDASGVATAPTFTANSTGGLYTVTAMVGTVGPANFYLTNQLSDLTITKTHTGNFSQGQIGATYTITVRNTGSGPTTGTVQVVDALPTGLTATVMGGDGWSCVLATLTCSRQDSLASSSNYPAIALTVDVAVNALASVTNQASVSGGGQINLSNDTASDPTTINPIVNVSGQVSVTNSGFVRNRNGQWVGTLTVSNTGGAAIAAPIQVVLTNLPQGVTMISNTGVRNGSPYITLLPSGTLAGGASVNAQIMFTNPNSVFITFTPVTAVGVF